MASERPGKQVRHLLERCLEASKRRDYALALTVVNEALKTRETDQSISLIHILDHRVAVYLRMEHLDQALKDAKAMIRLDPKDARGYIRSGISERRRNNKLGAMRFFEHGLKKVPDSDANHALLVKEMEKTAELMRIDIVHSQAKDPFSVLPLEVIEMVLSFLDYRTSIRLLRVSRSWNKTVSSSHPLVDILAFPASTQPVTQKWLAVALNRCRKLKTAIVPQLSSAAAEYFCHALAQSGRFPELQVFHWIDVPRSADWLPVSQYDLRTIVIDSRARPISIQSIDTVLRKLRSLEVAVFRYVSGLLAGPVSLHSNSLLALDMHCIDGFLDHRPPTGAISFDCPRLRTLSLQSPPLGILDVSHLTELSELDVRDSHVSRISLPASLRRLQLIERSFPDRLIDPGAPNPPLNELVELQLAPRATFPQFLHDCIKKTAPGKLSKFTMAVNEHLAQDLITIMSMPWFQTVKYLHLTNIDFISPHAFPHIKKCLALEELYIKQAGRLGTFVSDLIREAAHLRHVTLDDCHHVSRDIIPWAAERGVEVKIVQRDTPASSRLRVIELR